ncbi:unnamed protein product [Brassica rapa]|uniref:Uncharacterized protein n=1 Tax=Brassica campestris TaxID=3711 RepID=A0A8D9H2U3_BRACM|nr:unnamed protein product [Brassica rapa]
MLQSIFSSPTPLCFFLVKHFRYNYRFRAEISVYNSGDKASFVLLGDAGTERTRRQASDLLDNYLGADHHSHQSCLSCAPSTSENNSGQSKLGARCGPPPLSSQ